MRSPALALSAFAYLCAALAALVVLAAMRMPSLGVSFRPLGAAVEARFANGARVVTSGEAQVSVESALGRMSARASTLVPDFEPTGSRSEIAAWYGARDRLARIGSAPGAQVRLAVAGQPRIFELKPRPRRLGDLSADVWLLIMQGCVIGLLGVWILVLRPRDPPAQLFCAACLGVWVAAFSGAVFDARELTAGGALLQTMQALNFIGSNICSAGLAGLFLVQPRRLTSPALAFALIAVAAIAGLLNGLGVIPLAAFYQGLLLMTLAAAAAFAAQWIAARGDPGGRAVLRWVGATTLIGAASLSAAMAAPALLGTPSLGGDGMSFIPLFFVFGGLAFGVGRYRLFELERWTFRLVLGAAGVVALLAADAALIGLLKVQGPLALAIAVLGIGYLYFPARALLWRCIVGERSISGADLFQSVAEVAFAPEPAQRRRSWRALLQRLFDPLEIAESERPSTTPTVLDQGGRMLVPATADEAALALRFRAKGRKLFGPAEAALVTEALKLLRAAEATREAYTRGVFEERRRIARDLHDDVAARLLTSLHRSEVREVREDVRKAMAEIRTIVSSLTGRKMGLADVVADLRFETVERLRTVGVELIWPVEAGAAMSERHLDYAVYRSLVSSHREVVSNIIQHADARSVRVSVRSDASALSIIVEDDGRGLDAPSRKIGGGHGLRNINQRLGEIGGRCALPPRERGACVDLTIPLAPIG